MEAEAIKVTVAYGGKRFEAGCTVIKEPGDKIKMIIKDLDAEPFFMTIKMDAVDIMMAVDEALDEGEEKTQSQA